MPKKLSKNNNYLAELASQLLKFSISLLEVVFTVKLQGILGLRVGVTLLSTLVIVRPESTSASWPASGSGLTSMVPITTTTTTVLLSTLIASLVVIVALIVALIVVTLLIMCRRLMILIA